MAEPPTMVLLHGLGANRHVWDPLIGAMPWDGAIVAPDLRGHGGAEWKGRYSFGAMAADMAEVLADEHLDYVVLGHSMGGIVGLALASGWFGPPPLLAATIGVKLRWSAEELSRIESLARRPPREFPNRNGAAEWFMKLAGLYGVFDADDERIQRAIHAGVMRTDTELRLSEDSERGTAARGRPRRPDAQLRFGEDSEPLQTDPLDQGWRATQDPATVEVGAPDMTSLLAAAKCPVAMALGEHDPLVSPEHHADLAAAATTNPLAADVTAPHVFAGLGHNAMIEDPDAVADWLSTLPGCTATR